MTTKGSGYSDPDIWHLILILDNEYFQFSVPFDLNMAVAV
jgi:hypothetical protein